MLITPHGGDELRYENCNRANPTSLLLADKFKTQVYAAFGSLEYNPTEQFSAGLAMRYDVEDRKTRSLVPTATDPFTGGPINPGQAFGPLTPKSQTFKQLQSKLSLSYKPTPDFNIYANWGIGFKSGGFNNQGASTIIDQNFNQFIGAGVTITDQDDKERSSAYEAGIKGSLWDNRVTFDLAGYHSKIDDMQFFEFFVGNFGLLRVVSNIDKVEVTGGELSVTAKDRRGLKAGRRGQYDRQHDQEKQLAALYGRQQVSLHRRLHDQSGVRDGPPADRHDRPAAARRLSRHRADLVPHRARPGAAYAVQRPAPALGVGAPGLRRKRATTWRGAGLTACSICARGSISASSTSRFSPTTRPAARALALRARDGQ